MKTINWIKENTFLILLLVISFVFRIYKLDFQSPWIDELFTMINSSSEKSFIEIYQLLKVDVHPPLYYYIVNVFFHIFGDSSFVARFVSVLFGVGGLLALYYLAKELFNKKTIGIIAVLLLTINHFHIYYSQEARMYTMLFFTSIMSFIFLIKFIKKPTLKTALLHSLFATLMIYTHFFALFTLFSQYLILLFFIIKPYKTTSKKFFLYTLFSGIIIVIIYIPAIFIFLGTSNRTSFWIARPEIDVYTAMFKEFFGFSEIVIMIAIIGILFFLFKLFQQNEKKTFSLEPKKEKEVFSFFVLFMWIFITLFVPFLLSFINLPMIVSRYFINIIPPLILLVAAGIYNIKNSVIKLTLISIFVLFSFADLIGVKNYYNGIHKTQFREVSQFIINHHKKNEKILSSFEYYFSYYVRAEKGNKITNTSLNQYVEKIINGEEQMEPFWYVDTNNPQDKITDKTNLILDSLFVIDENITLFDAYAKHYHDKKTFKPNINFSKYKPYKDRNGDDINFSVEIFNETKETVELSGWAYFYEQSMQNTKIYLALVNETDEIILNPEKVNRDDVTSYFKSQFDLSRSGFKIKFYKKSYQIGNYKLALYLYDDKTKKESLVLTDKIINIYQ